MMLMMMMMMKLKDVMTFRSSFMTHIVVRKEFVTPGGDFDL